ncbi:MAG TPA: capsule assembly Wzi family protein [Bacillota bacterium]|nr:capsule assembly Wzi family protein [Bacillota bacterium]
MRRLQSMILVTSVVIAATLGAVTYAAPDVPNCPLHVDGGLLTIVYDSPDSAPALSVEYDGLQLLLVHAVEPFGPFEQFGSSRRLELFAGAGLPKWGPGRTGSLMMSGRTAPLPHVGYHLAVGRADYVRFVGMMESEQRRRLLGHRLEYSPTPWLHLGVSETAVVSGEASPLLYWPFPGLPLYALQRAVSQRDIAQDSLINVNFGADFVATLPGEGRRPELQAYGELLIDDAQGTMSDRDSVPDFLGGLVGVRVPRFTSDPRFSAYLEYVAISSYVYSHRNPDNNYVYRGTIIGHSLGPDADMLAVVTDFRPDSKTAVSLTGAVVRHGESEIGHPWSPAEGRDREFPSGIVEKTLKASLEVERMLLEPVLIVGRLELGTTFNKGHVQGSTQRYWSAAAGIGVRL